MKKNAIWIIVGLMTAALLGIIAQQGYWINNAISLTEDQFDKDVTAALRIVAQKLQEKEAEEMDKLEDFLTVSERVNLDAKSRFNTKVDFSGIGAKKEDIAEVTRDFHKLKRWKPQSLENRIDRTVLDDLLKRELKIRNKEANYDYQVYSTFKGSKPTLIINNGTFTINPETTDEVTELSEEVFTSEYNEYRQTLFDEDITSPGELVVSFPQKTREIWGAVLVPLISAILFTAIILFCFVYTIKTIFAQKKVSEMKTDFVNNMTHEFKTPIATISLAVDSITSPMILSKQDKIKRFADIIKQENKRMLAQVEKVLQMALLDKKDFNLNLDFVDLHEVINQAVTNSHLQAEKKGGSVSANLQATNSRIEGDLTHISNIIHNLLDNANKYSREVPVISVHTRNVSNGVEVIVKDNGIGLSKEARKNIFDKFYRVHTGNVHDVKGFGLGLAYVKTMMTAHKGQIDVKSELGKGSSFILTFPFTIREQVA